MSKPNKAIITSQDDSISSQNLTEDQILALSEARKNALEQIKSQISRKIYYQIEEKLLFEQNRLQEILDWQQGRSAKQAKYTYILDPHFFEQEFLN